MKKLLVLFGIFILSSPAFGATYSFTDFGPTAVNYWPGWGNGSGQDFRDTIGYPQFFGGTYTINDTTGRLTGISFNYFGMSGDFYDPIRPGDLFLDLGNDADWDYVVNSYTITKNQAVTISSLDNLAMNDPKAYQLSDTTWLSGGQRLGHPVALNYENFKDITSAGQVGFGGWTPGIGNHSTFFDFSKLAGGGLYIGPGDFQFGFTINCANDVVLAQGTNPVPEPATMLLLGIGLMGMAGFARRKGRS